MRQCRSSVVALLVLVIAAVLVPVIAEEGPGCPLDGPQFTVGIEERSSYLVDTGQVYHDDWTTQGFLGMEYKGWYLELWGSWSATGGYGNEADLMVKKTWTLPGNTTIAAKALYIDVNDHYFERILIPSVIVTTTVRGVGLSFEVKRARTFGPGDDGALVAVATTSYELPLMKRTFLGLRGDIARDWGAFGSDQAWIVQPRATVRVKVTDTLTFDAVTARYSLPIHSDDSRLRELSWSTGLSYNF